MGKIQKLSEQLTNLIAAGEVVERPMGVVKELVENSIDAGAKDIEIRIENGGLKRIVVIDQGCGMSKEDASTALQRHATSKIKETSDLFKISTLGFRGEALPSIASVSRFDLLTSDGNDSTEIKVEYGKTIYAGPKAAAKGTMITVDGLFYHTPARLKHMRSEQSEGSAIISVIERFAISRPDIAFRLYNNEVLRIKTSGNNSIKEIIYSLYGQQTSENLIEEHFEDYDFKVQAEIVMPFITRATRQYIQIYVNDRMIRDYEIQKAVIEAYSEYMPKDRYPICILKVQSDYQLVDVNVHPSKWEIRISKEKQLAALIKNGIMQALREKYKFKETNLYTINRDYLNDAGTDNNNYKAAEQLNFSEADSLGPDTQTTKTTTVDKEENNKFDQVSDAGYSAGKNADLSNERLEISENKDGNYLGQQDTNGSLNLHNTQNVCNENRVFPDLRIIGQFKDDYILAQDNNDLYIIDQHAAAERINFERLSKQANQKPVTLQPLLIPLTIDITPTQQNEFKDYQKMLEEFGMHFEEFGTNTIICREIPNWLTDIDVEAVVKDLMDSNNLEMSKDRADIQRHLIATMACHSSIRFNHRLSLPEMEKIVENLRNCSQPFNCPHGRPTIIKLSSAELRKEFERG